MYAIVDIETTGGKYNEEGITEIAIYKFDGHQIVDEFASLVNPERKIDPFVVKLTGINNHMLRNAPKFYEVAKRIVEITKDCVLVAHNATFDSRILATEFRRLGYAYHRETLCTVQLSRRLIPGLPSYSLGKLTKSLGIPLTDRHRAQGDARATVELFKLLLSKDVNKEIVQSHIQAQDPKDAQKLKLLRILDATPNETGVFYLHNEEGKIIYIAKGKNIRKSMNQVFSKTSKKYRNIQKQVKHASFALTGNMLIASLKEYEDIKTNKPKYSRNYRNDLFPYQLNQRKDEQGYISLKIEETDLRKRPILLFKNKSEAKRRLAQITETYELSFEKNDLNFAKEDSTDIEEPKVYNKKVQGFLKDEVQNKQHVLLIDKGRELGERSVIYMKNGVYQGYGFYALNHQIGSSEILEQILVNSANKAYAKHMIESYLSRNEVKQTLYIPQNF